MRTNNVLMVGMALILSLAAPRAGANGPGEAKGVQEPSSGKGLTIVVIGASVAVGIGAHPLSMGWAGRYDAYLKTLNPANKVIDIAVGGYTTYHLLPTGTPPKAGRPTPDPLHNVTRAVELRPDAIFLNLPSNDAANGFSAAEQEANVMVIAAAVRAAHIPLWVSSSQPRNLPPEGRATLRTMRDWVLSTFGSHAIDFLTPISIQDGGYQKRYDSGDGIHPNNVGHAMLFRQAFNANIPAALGR